jgi:hypothetical protein
MVMNPNAEIKNDDELQSFEELLHEIGELVKLAEIEEKSEKISTVLE